MLGVSSGIFAMVQRWPQTSGAPALGAASLADSWEVVKILIEQGVDVKSDAGGAALEGVEQRVFRSQSLTRRETWCIAPELVF